jgi:hypothetical protein
MFAAAMLYAAPNVEVSIYSTCKRISHKLLRNVANFLDMIYASLGVPPFKVIRANMEELVIQGADSPQDRRVVNSYPSKVGLHIIFFNMFAFKLYKQYSSIAFAIYVNVFA